MEPIGNELALGCDGLGFEGAVDESPGVWECRVVGYRVQGLRVQGTGLNP